jgi:hypothetical protein
MPQHKQAKTALHDSICLFYAMRGERMSEEQHCCWLIATELLVNRRLATGYPLTPHL